MLYLVYYAGFWYFYLLFAKIKQINANTKSFKTDSISQIPKTGSFIIFDSVILTIKINGMANKKTIPVAVNLFVLPMYLKIAALIHKNIIEITDDAVPIENTSFTFSKLLSINKYGTIKTLNDNKPAIIPFLPDTATGKNTAQANAIERVVINDHVQLPDIAISQIRQIIIADRKTAEKTIGISIFFFILDLLL